MTTLTARSTAAPPEAMFAVGAVSQYLGAAIAVGLFDSIAPAGVAWFRVLGAALVILAWRRPWRRHWTRAELGWAAAFGTSLAVMNLAFYLAIDDLPLGNAVAIEFLGPIAVAVVGSRTSRAWTALLLAVAGVVLLAGVQSEGGTRGVVFALVAGTCWAGYIVLGHRVARNRTTVDGLGVGMLIGAAAIAAFGAPHVDDAVSRPWLLILALTTGVLSNAIPYAIDQVVLQRIDAYRFALLQAMLPASATVIGLVALSQVPSPAELAGIALVVMGLAVGRAPQPGGGA